MLKKAIILFTGGIDSTTCIAIAKSQGFACYALSFLYGQKNAIEIARAQQVAPKLGIVEHKILHLPLDEIRGSSLTDSELSVPDYTGDSIIPSTYVPARNTIFLSLAIAWAEVIDAHDIFFGANYIDYSSYPDCRPAYIRAFEDMANLATKVSIEEGKHFKIHAPLLRMNKAEIVQEGMRLKINFADTISCYRADLNGSACGRCHSCSFRKKGFAEAGFADPTPYYS